MRRTGLVQLGPTGSYWRHSFHEEGDAEKVDLFLVDEDVNRALPVAGSVSANFKHQSKHRKVVYLIDERIIDAEAPWKALSFRSKDTKLATRLIQISQLI
jgi:hypothetical protein